MAIELPQPVVDFLNFIGVSFPQINEDSVRAFGTHVREFAQNIQSTHDSATSTVQQVGQAYQGASYELLVSRWADMSAAHMKELVEACNTVATALDVAADFIVGKKVEAIAQFAVMAAEFVADQAASIATLGLAEAAEVAIVAAAKELSKFLEQELEQYLIGEVLQAAMPPLVEAIQQHGRAVFGQDIPASGTPLYTDVRLYSEQGVPAVIYGAGPRTVLESNAKRADEHLVLEDLRRATKVVARTLLELLTP